MSLTDSCSTLARRYDEQAAHVASVTDQFGNTQQALQELQAEFADQQHEQVDLKAQVQASKAVHVELQSLHATQTSEVLRLSEQLTNTNGSAQDLQVITQHAKCVHQLIASARHPTLCAVMAASCTLLHALVGLSQCRFLCRHLRLVVQHHLLYLTTSSVYIQLHIATTIPYQVVRTQTVVLSVACDPWRLQGWYKHSLHHIMHTQCIDGACWWPQTQLRTKQDEAMQQTAQLRVITEQHEQLQTAHQALEAAVQSLREQLHSSHAHAQQLQTQLTDRGLQLQNAQIRVQQKAQALEELESHHIAQKAELDAAAQQGINLEADNQQQKKQLEVAAADKVQMQSTFDTVQTAAAEQLSSFKIEVHQLQVRSDSVIPLICKLGLMSGIPVQTSSAVSQHHKCQRVLTSLLSASRHGHAACHHHWARRYLQAPAQAFMMKETLMTTQIMLLQVQLFNEQATAAAARNQLQDRCTQLQSQHDSESKDAAAAAAKQVVKGQQAVQQLQAQLTVSQAQTEDLQESCSAHARQFAELTAELSDATTSAEALQVSIMRL